MNLKPVQIELETEEIQRLLRIGLDKDVREALEFVQEVLVKKVEKALQRR